MSKGKKETGEPSVTHRKMQKKAKKQKLFTDPSSKTSIID